jgi:23S rRNA (uracil-5-)-methyltransferase RumA
MKAPCPFFGKCAGCTKQQHPYPKQLRDKAKLIRELLGPLFAKYQLSEESIAPIVASPLPFDYRISTKLCLNLDKDGQETVGLYAHHRKQVVAIKGCKIHHPAINRFIERLFHPRRPRPAPFYNHLRGFQSGCLKFITIRHAPATGELGVIISHTGVPKAALLEMTQGFLREPISFYETSLTPADRDLVVARKVNHLSGPAHFNVELAGHTFQLTPDVFFQANGLLIEDFIAHITEDFSGAALADIYGGFGAYSFALASRFREIHLIEASRKAVALAAEHAKAHGIKNVMPRAQRAEEFLAKWAQGSPSRSGLSHVIVNPPRGGLSDEVIRLLTSPKLESIRELRYVSCNPETLRRDLMVLLQKGGFDLTTITPFDMFPQTPHVELVTRLVRR